ncbi:MAG: hypothetical protein WCK89_05725 [bacterium]
MKRMLCVQERATGCVVMTLLLMAGAGLAQIVQPGQQRLTPSVGQPAAVRGGEKSEAVEIRRMPPPNKTAMVRAPEFTYNVQNTMPRVTKKPREWALFEVKYESAAKWTDELTFSYHVMTKGKTEEGRDAYSYYTATLRYVDIAKGEHMSCVAIPPSQIERYGEPVAVALEITNKEGKVLDSKSEALMALPKEWWKDSNVLDKPQVTRRNGLIDRSKTPFALINVDDYEVVQ